MHIFRSKFANSIQDMFVFKEQLGYSRSTHEPSLRHFDRFCVECHPEAETLSEKLALSWLEKRPNENSGGLKKRANTIRQFGKYLNYVGVSAYVLPAGYIGGNSSFAPYILSDDELASFFAAADNIPVGKFSPCRHYVISVFFRLLYCCGLRPNECRLLKTEDVELQDGKITVRDTKKNRDRIVMMSNDMLALCIRYNDIVKGFYPNRTYFFPNSRGGAYASNSMIHMFLNCWRKTKESKESVREPRIYDLRHRFATAILMEWIDKEQDIQALLPQLSVYMGHVNLSATAYYIHLLPSNLTQSTSIDWKRFSDLIPEVKFETV